MDVYELPTSLVDLGAYLLSSKISALLEEIEKMLDHLREIDHFLIAFRSLRIVLLALIRQAQVEGVLAVKGNLLEQLRPHKFPCKQFNFAKRMAQYALKIYNTSWSEAPDEIARALGLPSADDVRVLHFADEDSDNISYPDFLILIDHEAESIILTIRGTHALKDVLIDLAGRDEEFLGLLNGHAHYAILCGALKILRETKPELIRLLDKYPEYKLVVTGHSLGAGTAVLATLEILLGSDPFVAPSRVKCIALAPPPVFRSEIPIPAEFADAIEIFIHRHDCVPSLSLGVYTKLVAAMKEIDRLELSLANIICVIIKPSSPFSFAALNSIQDAISSVDTKIPLLKHPGQVYYFHQKQNQDYEIFKLDGEFFSDDLMLLPQMILDHMQWNYEKAFDAIGPDQLYTETDD